DHGALETVLQARPDVLNHNLETVLRLHRAVRPSANYVRSLTVLARAKDFGLTTKSGLIVGMGESIAELKSVMRDIRSVGVDILTVGQYLRPTRHHLPVSRYYHPDEFRELRDYAMSLGFRYVEASPLARSSYHARQGSDAAAGALA
ncbi:MAG: lipoyl synthase, partial [Actinobacteria bacterium]|nr:lipoyl synthase [Actinomycetota bacterium]